MLTIRTFGRAAFTVVLTFIVAAHAADAKSEAASAPSKSGPHGGDLQPAGDHHAELTFYNGQFQLFVYKPDGTSPEALTATRLTAAVTVPGDKAERRVVLAAKPQDADPKHASSRFVGEAAYLKDAKAVDATVGFAIDRKPYRVTFHAASKKPLSDDEIAVAGHRKKVTFFGVEFEISTSTPKAVLDQLSARMDKAVQDENAGKFESALKQMRQIRADLPSDIHSTGLDEAITRVEGKIGTKGAASDIDQRIAAAINLANMDKYAEALAALKQIKKDLPKDVKAPGLDAAIAEVEQKLKEQK
ncbi:MAG: hypothetical protein GC159_17190 [Phycisphaera sp.]|nr:hypothetical protein [Phycisphaera sp.]